MIGIITLQRKRGHADSDPLAACCAALERGEIMLIFPEGSRGEPEQMTQLKSGIAHLAERFPTVPVVPVFMHGLGKSMPRGEWLLVPFFCDVFIGLPLLWCGERKAFMDGLRQSLHALKEKLAAPEHL